MNPIRTRIDRSKPPCSGRRGVTLTEVLMSMMIMGIGVVAVATLFPISMLRSAQATKLTNAVNHRYNAEAFTRMIPRSVNIASEWQPAATYAAGDLVIPAANTRLKTPPAVFRCVTAGASGSSEPFWNFTPAALPALSLTNELAPGAAVWGAIRLKNYIVDPLGSHTSELTAVPSVLPGVPFFGNTGTNAFFPSSVNPSSPAIPVFRFPGGATTLLAAQQLAVLPDSWVNIADSKAVVLAGNTLTLTDVADDFAVTIPNTLAAGTRRVVMFDVDGRRSVNRLITGVSVNSVTWNATEALPAGFTPATARVELIEDRYSWILSVRRGLGGSTFLDAVVFFRRPLSPIDERVYTAVFREFDMGPDGQPGAAGVDDDNSDGDDVPATGADEIAELGHGADDSTTDDRRRNWVIVQWPTADDKPFFKKGGFICDVPNLQWYRVIDVSAEFPALAAATPVGYTNDLNATYWPAGVPTEINAPATAQTYVRLTLDRNIATDSTTRHVAAAPADNRVGGAMIMRNVVEVYPLPSLSPFQE